MKRMLKQLIATAAAVLLIVSSFTAVALALEEGFSGEQKRLMDMADLLTDQQEEEIQSLLDEISER